MGIFVEKLSETLGPSISSPVVFEEFCTTFLAYPNKNLSFDYILIENWKDEKILDNFLGIQKLKKSSTGNCDVIFYFP